MSTTTCIENVKTRAKIRGITLGQIEKAAGVSVGYLSRKREDGDIPVSVLLKIADRLRVPINELLTDMTDDDIFHDYVETGRYSSIGIEKTAEGFCCYILGNGRVYRTPAFGTIEEAGEHMTKCIKQGRKSI